MAEIAVERDFAASADAAWEKLGNFGEMGWMPGVASCEVEGEGELRLPKGQRNPGGLDYRAYLERRQVFGVLYPHRNQKVVPTANLKTVDSCGWKRSFRMPFTLGFHA